MKLAELIDRLVALKDAAPEAAGMTVYYRRSSSGDCGELHYPRISTNVEDTGPFDEDGPWVEISAGH